MPTSNTNTSRPAAHKAPSHSTQNSPAHSTAGQISLSQTWLRIGVIYGLTLITALACSKFEVKKPEIVNGATTRGTGTVVPPAAPTTPSGQPANVPAATAEQARATINIDSVIVSSVSDTATEEASWLISSNVTNGTQKLIFTVSPSISPIMPDSVLKVVDSTRYSFQGMCFDFACEKFAVLLQVTDESKKIDYQTVQIWERTASNQKVLNTYKDTDYKNIIEVYETQTGTKLPDTSWN